MGVTSSLPYIYLVPENLDTARKEAETRGPCWKSRYSDTEWHHALSRLHDENPSASWKPAVNC